MEYTLGQVAKLIKGKVQGNADLKIGMLSTIEEAKPGQITFLANAKYESLIYDTKATAVIVKIGFVPKKTLTTNLILVEDPYLSFIVLLEEYKKTVICEKSGTEQPCHRGENTTVGKNLYQGAFSYIGNNVKIGDNVKIYPHVFIDNNVVIGDNTILYSGVKVYAFAQIGKYCTIHSGVVLGSDGFGFLPQKDGTYKSIPQLGNIVLKDHVRIGANTTIDCATLWGHSTIIGAGTKLDNLIQIGHNVKIEKNTVMAAQSGIAGSTKIGKQCIIGGQVGISGHLNIADNTSIGPQAGITKSVEKNGEQLLGSPALSVKGYMKSYAVFKQLPYIKFNTDSTDSSEEK